MLGGKRYTLNLGTTVTYGQGWRRRKFPALLIQGVSCERGPHCTGAVPAGARKTRHYLVVPVDS